MPTAGLIGVTGATGLIGRALTRSLTGDGHEVVAFSRSPRTDDGERTRAAQWYPDDPERNVEALDGIDSVVHLAGASVAVRWNHERKAAIRDSRIEGTRTLIEAIRKCPSPPHRLLSASAIGFYGPRGDEELSEDAAPGEGFLAETCVAWEAETRAADIPHTALRIGIVLSPDGGALKTMLPPFRFGLGGRVGSGQQWMPWIHLDDVVGAIRHLLDADPATLQQAYNLTAPAPVRNAEFTKALGRALRRPTPFPVPGFGMRLAFGEMADALLLTGARVVPANLGKSGYSFAHSEVGPALADLLRK